jgi:hypothetical protein
MTSQVHRAALNKCVAIKANRARALIFLQLKVLGWDILMTSDHNSFIRLLSTIPDVRKAMNDLQTKRQR